MGLLAASFCSYATYVSFVSVCCVLSWCGWDHVLIGWTCFDLLMLLWCWTMILMFKRVYSWFCRILSCWSFSTSWIQTIVLVEVDVVQYIGFYNVDTFVCSLNCWILALLSLMCPLSCCCVFHVAATLCCAHWVYCVLIVFCWLSLLNLTLL